LRLGQAGQGQLISFTAWHYCKNAGLYDATQL
jgi:hypothetical protein